MNRYISFIVLGWLLFGVVGGSARAQVTRPVTVMVQITLKPDQQDAFEALAKELKTRVTREDKGNIRYEFYRVKSAQGTSSTSWVFIEQWADEAAFAAHGQWARPIVQSKWPEMSTDLKILRLDTVD